MKRSFYSDFQDRSKKEWIEKIEADLKGKPIRDLNKKLSEEWEMSPFFTMEDVARKYPALSRYFPNSLIAQSFNSGDPELKERITDAMANGLQSPVFENVNDASHLSNALTPEQWSILTPVFKCTNERKLDDLKVLSNHSEDVLIKLDNSAHNEFGTNVKSIAFHLPACQVKEMPGNLGSWLYSIVKLLDNCKKEEAKDVLGSCWIEIEQGKNYYIEIARIRAIRVLWSNLLQNYGFNENIPLPIIANVGKALDNEDPYMNMICYTTAGIYAMIAGADIVNIAPIGDKDNKFSAHAQRRISRNILNIAQLESHLDQVTDPAAGSYAFEKITWELAGKSWQVFLDKTGSPVS